MAETVEGEEKKSSRKAAGFDLEVMELDDLVPLSREALDEIYRASTVPKVDDFTGPLEGRVLYGLVPTFHSQSLRQKMINRPWLPWRGKSFSAENETKGSGSNRLHVGPIDFDFFKFELSIAPSIENDLEVLRLNYNLRGNLIVRMVIDECRKVNDRFLLGQAYLVMGKSCTFLCYFAIGKPEDV